ncbi:MAG: hypothetical protein GYB67_02640 [Chloroflexi bacterium]|nr:hypothetical protein [Chloroflexota bacterium]
MLRAALWMALIFTLVGTALLAALRAQPYTAPDIRTLIAAPDGCPDPCWQGIRPGVTTLTMGADTITRHPWVGNLVHIETHPTTTHVRWAWSGAQPAYIDTTRASWISGVPGRPVTMISLKTTLRFGDLWLQLGRPQARALGSYTVGGPPLQFLAYADAVVSFAVWPGCAQFWHQPVDIVYLPDIGDVDVAGGGYDLALMRATACNLDP